MSTPSNVCHNALCPNVDEIDDLRVHLTSAIKARDSAEAERDAALKERDEARAQLKAAVAAHEESDTAFHEAADACERAENLLADAVAERDRLRAALEPATANTKKEVEDYQRKCIHLDDGPMQRGTVCWVCAIATLRAKAGLS